jgi:membrane-bound lytic murein transglycosylase D
MEERVQMTLRKLQRGIWPGLLSLSLLMLGSHTWAQDAESGEPGPTTREAQAATAQPAEAAASAVAPAVQAAPAAPASAEPPVPARNDPALILNNQVPTKDAAVDDTANAPRPEVPPLVGTEIAPAVEQISETPVTRKDLWERLRQHYALPVLDTELVRKWEQYYATRPDYLQRMLDRGGRYLFHIVEEVNRRQMPAELALLPFVESAFNPHAVSSARASGIWQFMPATGRSFDLTQNVFRDDRRSVLDSTRAALDYLNQLHGMFGDWQLALAAYNWGQGNVGRALANNRRQSRGVRYEDLSMPDETRNYVPKLQAIANLVSRPEQFGLQLPPLENHPYFLTVKVDRDIDVAVAARLAGLSIEEFQALNPQMNKPVILAAGTSQLLLPFDNAQRYQREVQQHRGPFATWTAWVAPATLNPAEVARRVGMSESQLRDVNRIPARMLVKAGSTLLVPRHTETTRDVSEHVADTASISLAPEAQPGRRLVVRAGPKGESVAALAQRHRVAAAQLASWNAVPANGAFKPGQQVVMFVKAAPAPRVQAAKGKARAVAKAPAARQQAKPAQHARPVVRVAAARPAAASVKR